MNRRSILKAGMATAGLALLIPKLSLAQDEQPGNPSVSVGQSEEMILTAEISANHGHELKISPAQALKSLQATKPGEAVSLDIKGKSGHPHAVNLTHEDLLVLFEQGEISKDSTLVAGHAHVILIQLDVVLV